VSERVVELNRPPAQSVAPAEFERTPPQDLAAEQSVLGGMLLHKDAIADVIEVARSGDFYRPAHQAIFDVIIELYGKGEPADAITVGAELTKNGDAGRVGGLPYLHTLVSTVPTAANAGYYAKIVAELAILRRLVEAGTRIVQLGYSADGQEVDDIVDRAQQAIYDVTERRTSEDYTLLEDLMQPTMDELEAIGGRAGMMSGVPTGFVDLDTLTNGLHPGQLIVIAGRPGLGKALALDTPLPTPTGWTTMGEVQVGAQLLDACGRPTAVVAATEVLTGRLCFEVTFSDGSTVVADAEHQWATTTWTGRKAMVRTTAQLAADIDAGHSVALTAPLALPETELAMAPYALGVWLAGGSDHHSVLMYAEDVPLELAADRTEVLAAAVRGSEHQRREVLAGLADVAGEVASDGSVVLPLLAGELALSLGHLVLTGRQRVRVLTEDRVFRREDRHLQHKQALEENVLICDRRTVVSVVPVAPVPVRCVEVDNPDHLYLAGRAMVPTHNSTLGLDIARSASIKSGQASVIFSLEMSKTEITMRLLSAEARVPLHHMRSGSMTDDDWARLARRMGEVAEAPLYIDDSPNLTMMEIRAKARRLKQRKDLRLIVIDYLQLMTGNKKAESRQQEVSELSRSLKLLAKELEVPVIAMSQLNRGAEQRTDKKPMLSDLRESGCLPASSRVLRADTGAETTLGSLFASGERDVPVWSLDASLRYVRRHLTHVFSTGTKEVFRLRLASGKTVRATANHPFLSYDGWKPLGDLGVGSRLAVPRHVPTPEQETSWSDDCVRAVAFDLVSGRPLPAQAFSLSKRQLRALLRQILAATRVGTGEGRAYALRSRRAADDLSRLLLRFGISCSLSELDVVGRTQLLVATGDDLARLVGQVESGLDGDAARDAVLDGMAQGRVPAQAGPAEVWDRVQAVVDGRALAPAGRLAGVASTLSAADLELEATNDVRWDTVVEIVPDGVEEVFDATVVGNHNFVADGVAVHNSIEQDADMVLLLHREDAYEKESPRAGEADFIVAKHRNGPTATITVAFQGHYSRFVDMSPS
jgi:replicative DNA helicase